jgi:hypothetical protein
MAHVRLGALHLSAGIGFAVSSLSSTAYPKAALRTLTQVAPGQSRPAPSCPAQPRLPQCRADRGIAALGRQEPAGCLHRGHARLGLKLQGDACGKADVAYCGDTGLGRSRAPRPRPKPPGRPARHRLRGGHERRQGWAGKTRPGADPQPGSAVHRPIPTHQSTTGPPRPRTELNPANCRSHHAHTVVVSADPKLAWPVGKASEQTPPRHRSEWMPDG